MSATTFGQKRFSAKAPDKGSFPLDHEGECKKHMLKYLLCLRQNNNSNTSCRILAKDYLQCRMDKQLMSKEDLAKLGFSDVEKQPDRE